MSQALLVVLDPDDIATLDAHVDTRVSVRQFSRLANLLCSHDGDIEVSVALERGDAGYPLVDGRVKADLDLVCQRCLDPMKLPIQTEFHLMLVADGATNVESQGRYEPYFLEESRAGGQGTRLVDIIEDELLLMMPFAPLHADRSECGHLAGRLEDLEDAAEEETRHTPFDVLKDREFD